jgi:hypothetical protein
MDRFGEDMKGIIQKVLKTYDIPVEEFLPLQEYWGDGKKNNADLVTKTKDKVRAGKDYPLLSVIEDFIIGEVERKLPEDRKGLRDTLMGIFKKIGGKNA